MAGTVPKPQERIAGQYTAGEWQLQSCPESRTKMYVQAVQCNSLTNTCAIIIEIIMCTQLIHRLVWRRKYLLFHCILLFLLLITRKCCGIGQAKEFCIVQIHRAGYVCVLCISHVHCLRKHITFGEYLDTYIYIIVTLITSME